MRRSCNSRQPRTRRELFGFRSRSTRRPSRMGELVRMFWSRSPPPSVPWHSKSPQDGADVFRRYYRKQNALAKPVDKTTSRRLEGEEFPGGEAYSECEIVHSQPGSAHEHTRTARNSDQRPSGEKWTARIPTVTLQPPVGSQGPPMLFVRRLLLALRGVMEIGLACQQRKQKAFVFFAN